MENTFKNNHLSVFWGENSSPQISLFTLNPHKNGNHPAIVVAVSQQGNTLNLSYYIESIDWLVFDELDPANIHRQDYLWEQTCLECFFECDNASAYLELNITPSGAFNIYQFDDYRTPDTLPPKRDDKVSLSMTDKQSLHGWHARHVGVKFDDDVMAVAKQSRSFILTKINPTAILYQNNQPIFYATHHANPPDFHHKAFWQTF